MNMKKKMNAFCLKRLACFAGAAIAAGMACAAAPSVYMNEDNDHFYANRPLEEMTREGCRKLVDVYADAGGVKGVLFCSNVQRALFDSKCWERFKDVKAPNKQLPVGLRLLSERGVDHLKEWLIRSKERGMEGWITMRMNDSHGLKEAATKQHNGWHEYWPTEMWRSHPEWRRAPYRSERSWEGSFNYLVPEVYAHHLNLVRELFERYGEYMTGFECDWMRWGFFFPPGHEVEGRATLTRFVKDLKAIASEAEKKHGRKIKLAHRVPTTPANALSYGFDVRAWKKLGAVDMLTVSPFLGTNDNQIPVDVWRAVAGDDTWINVCTYRTNSPYPGQNVDSQAFMLGTAASALARGADGIYLFNECYLVSAPKGIDELNRYLPRIGSLDGIAEMKRRIGVTHVQTIMPGESNRSILPIPLQQEWMGVDMARMEANITVRFDAGKVTEKTKAIVNFAFDADTDPAKLRTPEVRVNTKIVKFKESKRIDLKRVNPKNVWQRFSDYPRGAAYVLTYEVPAELLKPTFNAVELMPPAIPGKLVWADLELED